MLKHSNNLSLEDERKRDATILADIFALQDPILALLQKAGAEIVYFGYDQTDCRMTLPCTGEVYHFVHHLVGKEFEAPIKGAMAVPVDEIPIYIARLNNSTECLPGYLALTILTARLEGKIS